MSDTYKVGKGRAAKTVQARQYTRDQDWKLADWIDGPVQVYRDHFRVGSGELFARKGDWILQHPNGTIEVKDNRAFESDARKVEE
jgi:hypothetical protein